MYSYEERITAVELYIKYGLRASIVIQELGYGVRTINVLTGFKFIGEVIGRLEQEGRESDFICGFEESYGYLTGSYVRDKDAVNAAFMICEMFAYYKTRDVSLIEKLDEFYEEYGYCLNTLHSYEFPGSAGMQEMARIMKTFREGVEKIGGMEVVKTEDFSTGLYGLPASDVLKFYFKGDIAGSDKDDSEEQGSVVIRPSGTEPKLKAYISVTSEDQSRAKDIEERIKNEVEELIRR